MLEALLSDTRDPDVLAELARGRLRAKLPALRQALVGNFKPHHALIVSHILAHLDYLDETIATLTHGGRRSGWPLSRTRLRTSARSPASPQRASQVILAELGPDMSRFAVRPPRRQLGGDLPRQRRVRRQAPLGQDPQGQPVPARRADRVRQRRRRTKNTYLRAQYEQIKRRRGHKKAIAAVAHSILIAAYHVLKDDVPYHDLGGDYFARRADPPTDHQTARRPARTARPPRHASNVNGRRGSQPERISNQLSVAVLPSRPLRLGADGATKPSPKGQEEAP